MSEKFEARDMTGGLFKNGKKKRGSEQPDYTGYVMVGGGRLQHAGWKKTSKAGEQYLSLKLETGELGAAGGQAADAEL
jgi:uncharacterized protein (DUF736 family)